MARANQGAYDAGMGNPPCRVAGVVLAAGLGTRMGASGSKVLRPVDGAPMVARVVDALVAGGVSEVVVVTGHEAAAVQAALTGRAVRFVGNPGFAEGLSTSVRAGIAALGEVDGALVALGDMPWVSAGDVAALIEAFARSGRIAAPVCEGRRGNPVLWPARYFAVLGRLEGDVGARAVLAAHTDDLETVPASRGVLRDVDAPEDLPG